MLLFLTACILGNHAGLSATSTHCYDPPGLKGKMGVKSLVSCSISSSTEPLRIKSLFPPDPPDSLPPFIIHIRSESSKKKLSEVIMEETGMDGKLVKELVKFGAVYTGPPQDAMDKKQSPVKAVRTMQDVELLPGSYVRVHAQPKRCLSVYKIDWSARVIRESQDFIVIDKPPGVPSLTTIDNGVECVMSQVEKMRNISLMPTSRLDVCTAGVLIFAKTRDFCLKTNKAMSERRCDKVYLLLSERELPRGEVRHLFCRKRSGHKNSRPTLLRAWQDLRSRQDLQEEGWQDAVLEILDCRPFDLKQQGGRRKVFEYSVRLITGRTHQIRLQFAALGAPVLGDTRYTPAAGLLFQSVDDAIGDGSRVFGPDPDVIFLQAHRVTIEGEESLSFEAGAPWWRDERETSRRQQGEDAGDRDEGSEGSS